MDDDPIFTGIFLAIVVFVLLEYWSTRSNPRTYHSIGRIESCFKDCVGTPRQGQLAPATRGRLIFDKSISPCALEGLEHFDLIWIIFVFHANTNVSQAKKVVRSNGAFTFRAKVSPPLLKKKVGVFATRSPHRPNPFGITLARIERIRSTCLELSSIDLITGTPVIDIKPYVPDYDSFPSVQVAEWIRTYPVTRSVQFTSPQLQQTIYDCALKSSLYKTCPQDMEKAIVQVLGVDVRSSLKSKAFRAERVEQVFDNLCIGYSVTEDLIVQVESITLR